MQTMGSDGPPSTYTVLVTGANSGLGYATCCRLMDEFLFTRPQSQLLNLIITTRDERKSTATIKRLHQHLQKTIRDANTKTMGIVTLLESRIKIEGEMVDLCSLRSVRSLAKRLLERRQRVDVLVLNAGIGGWRGLDWGRAVWTVLTDWVNATTYPTYKLGYTGNVTKRQVAAKDGEEGDKREPVLGETFTANVFGHYLLAHLLVPVMVAEAGAEQGRIIWVSSLEAYAHCFSLDDIQGLKTDASYESSKRLTDLLVLTSELPSTKPYTTTYLSASDDTKPQQQDGTTPTPIITDPLPPKMYLAHPGICGTSIANLHPIMDICMHIAFYVSRFLGSPWHTISAYLGACAPVWLALTPVSELASLETSPRSGVSKKGKWGSSTDFSGAESVRRTEVEGWGWSGQVGEKADGRMKSMRGRWSGMKDVSDEARVEFEEAGRKVWAEMEELRKEWEGYLEGAEQDV